MRPSEVLAKYLHVPEGDAGGWVTFRPSLVRALLAMTARGPISGTLRYRVVELGTGNGSSPMLSELARAGDGFVEVLAVEADPEWFEKARALEHVHYRVMRELVEPIDDAFNLDVILADVVLVDHGPVEARARDLSLLARNPNVGLVVVHDWNVDVYGYDKSPWLWRVEDRGRWPNTAVLSNTVDLSAWLGYEGPMSKRDETIAAWDAVAQQPDRATFIHPSGVDVDAYEESGRAQAREVVRLCDCLVPGGGQNVLDFGCGDGRVLRHLRTPENPTVRGFGWDSSPAMRDAARRAGCVVEDALDVSDAGAYDLVFSFAVFIHHTYNDGALMLRELARVVRLDGIVAVDVPIYDEPHEPVAWNDVGVWTVAQLIRAASFAGLELVELHENHGAFSYAAVGPNHGRLQVFRKVRG